MNFAQAINSLKDGQAAKLSNWGGFVFRKNTEIVIPEYDPDSVAGYPEGFIVKYNGETYKCVKAIPAGTAAGYFSFMNWERFSNLPFSITFRNRAGQNFVANATYSEGGSGTLSFTDFSPALDIDGQLFEALLSDDWVVGSKDDFEQILVGDSRW